jgi:hypothetical protein
MLLIAAFTTFAPFSYQQVNLLGAFETSLRFIPMAVAGFSVDVVAGYAMGRTPGQMLILLGLSGTVVCANIGHYLLCV